MGLDKIFDDDTTVYSILRADDDWKVFLSKDDPEWIEYVGVLLGCRPYNPNNHYCRDLIKRD